MNNTDPFWTAQQVADLLNIQPSTVYALCRRGELPHVRITQGARRALIRFDPDAIRKFIASRSHSAREIRRG